MFVFSAVANGFNVRSEGINIFDHIKENKGFIKVMLTIVLVQIILTFVGGEIFSCTPFGIKGWLIIIVMSLTMIPVDMLRKIIMKSSKKSITYENNVEAV